MNLGDLIDAYIDMDENRAVLIFCDVLQNLAAAMVCRREGVL